MTEMRPRMSLPHHGDQVDERKFLRQLRQLSYDEESNTLFQKELMKNILISKTSVYQLFRKWKLHVLFYKFNYDQFEQSRFTLTLLTPER